MSVLFRSFSNSFNFLDHLRIFECRQVAWVFSEIGGTNDAAHYFGVAGFGQCRDEMDMRRRERFAHVSSYE